MRGKVRGMGKAWELIGRARGIVIVLFILFRPVPVLQAWLDMAA
jgi:hypothetical protein